MERKDGFVVLESLVNMHVRTLLYLFITPLVIYALESLNIEHLFKRGRNLQIILIYLFLALSLSYLSVNFMMDFVNSYYSVL